jgi:hypothetical protein
MKVTEASIAQVVSEASARMHDPKYITGQVDRLMSAQPAVTQYVVAHQAELTVEGIVTALFHVSLIHESIRRGLGRLPSRVSYADLDRAARSAPTVEALADIEADLASYIVSNVELEGDPRRSAVAQKILTHVAMALVE